MPTQTAMTIDREMELALRWQIDEDYAARDELVRANERIINRAILKFADRGVPIEDLKQEGWMGLCRAVDDFDGGLSRFCTHAMWWVKEKMRMAVYDQGRTIQAAIGTQKIAAKYRRLKTHLGAPPSREQAMDELDLTPSRYDDVMAVLRTESVKHTGDTPVPNRPKTDVDLEKIKRALDTLHPNQKYVVERCFGLDGGSEDSWDRIARRRNWDMWQVKLMFKGGCESFRTAYENAID